MTAFLDGPLEGALLDLRTVPFLLRVWRDAAQRCVTVERHSSTSLHAVAEAHAYVRCHPDGRPYPDYAERLWKGRSPGAGATFYRLLSPQPPLEVMCCGAAWLALLVETLEAAERGAP